MELSDLGERKIWGLETGKLQLILGKEHMRIFETCVATPSSLDQLSRKLTKNSHDRKISAILKLRGLLPRVAPPAEGSLGHDSL
jgi:hypothetical protein